MHGPIGGFPETTKNYVTCVLILLNLSNSIYPVDQVSQWPPDQVTPDQIIPLNMSKIAIINEVNMTDVLQNDSSLPVS